MENERVPDGQRLKGVQWDYSDKHESEDQFMMVETSRIRVRPLVEADLPAYRRILEHPDLAAANGVPTALSPDLLNYWFEKDRHSPYAFAVIDRQQHRLIGGLFYYQHAQAPATYDLGYFLEPQAWGHGWMPTAIRLSWELINQRPLTLWADCLPTNHRSQGVLRKLGFTATSAPTTGEMLAEAPAEAVWYQRTLTD